MGKLLAVLLLLLGLGGYLYYVRGWDWDKAKQAVVEQVPFLGDDSATTTPIGSRGVGTRWEIATPMPSPRGQVGAVEIGGQIFVVGGIGAYGGTLSLLEIYDIEKDSWAVGPKMPQALHHPAVATDGEKLFVFGGLSGLDSRPIDAAYEYDPKLREWRELPRLSDFRGAAGAGFIGKLGYVVGGINPAGPTASSEFLAAERTGWNAAPDMSIARQRLTVAAVDKKLYAMGGDTGDAQHALAAVEAFDGGRWTARKAMPRLRTDASAAVSDGKIYIMGGEHEGGIWDSVDIYDPKKDEWTTMHLVMPSGRHGFAAVPYKNRIYAIGGGERPGFSVSDIVEVLIVEGSKKQQ